ncbi:MAG: hypothetical protein HKN19_15995 [Halioglobus sp.]|nr:hypothetical protein [Halioglobus sp.]
MSRDSGQGRPGTLYLLLFVVGAVLIGMYLGRHMVEQDVRTATAAGPDVTALEQSLRKARAELEVSTTRHDVDRQALQMVRAELAAQKNEIAALEEDLRFYRGLMAPETTDALISLVPPEITYGATPGEYSYRIVVLQRARKHEWASGSVAIAVSGTGIDGPVSYALAELSEGVTENDLELGFRYFQAVEGELSLPQGFQPLAIEIAATVQKPRKLQLKERYPWPF